MAQEISVRFSEISNLQKSLLTLALVNPLALLENRSRAVVLKLFGSWATFIFQKPFAGHKN